MKAKKTKRPEREAPTAIGDVLTKTQTFDEIVERLSGDEKLATTRRQVAAVVGAYHDVLLGQLMPGGAGKAKMHGVAIFVARKVKAKKGGQKVVSFGVERVTKDKPATVRLRIRPMTSVKRAVIPPKLLAQLDDLKAKARKASAKARAAAPAKKAKPGAAKKKAPLKKLKRAA